MSEDYDKIAKELNIKYRIGKWGIQFLPKAPTGIKSYRLFSITPLDGWVTDPKEVERIIRERGMEL